MDKKEQERLAQLYNGLEKQFIEQQKVIDPIVNKLKDMTQKATNLVFRVYKQNCKAEFTELEKYATFSKDMQLSIKNPKDGENAYKTFINLLTCIKVNNKDFENAMKKLDEQNESLSSGYDNCMLACGKDSSSKTDQVLSDCFLKCNNEFINVYKNVSVNLTDDFTSICNKLEKL